MKSIEPNVLIVVGDNCNFLHPEKITNVLLAKLDHPHGPFSYDAVKSLLGGKQCSFCYEARRRVWMALVTRLKAVMR